MASMVQTKTLDVPSNSMTAETSMQLRLQNNPSPSMKPKTKLRLDPHRALEPARKKLSTVESQRIMAVLTDCIKKIEITSAIPELSSDPARFSVAIGTDLVSMLEEHKVIIQSYEDLKGATQRSETKSQDGGSRPGSGGSNASQSDTAIRNLGLVAQQMQQSCKNIIRAFARDPAAMTNVLKAQSQTKKGGIAMVSQLEELKDIIMGMLLTTPTEEIERNQYLKQVSERERFNAGVIKKLEAELHAAMDDKEYETQKKNDVIRKLTAEIDQIEKFAQDQNRRTKSEAEKQETADVKNSEGKKGKLTQDLNQLKAQLQTLIAEHRENETALRQKKFKVETEVENWIQKFDQDIGERQEKFEEIDKDYTLEKKQLTELEERFKTLEEEYNQIMEERRIARERQEAAERELQMNITAATCIQAFWRSFKVRKALKAKKKKKGGKKKGK